jgi:adenylosuccinate synthase
VRFNGGHNAGHTLVAGGRTCVVTLVPSGVMAGRPGLIGPGVVVDPFALLGEIDRLVREGFRVTPDTLRVAETVALVLPVHGALDRLRNAGSGSLGTTGRGIGPAHEDKVGRRALRLCDLADDGYALERLRGLVAHNNLLLRALGGGAFDAGQMWPPLRKACARLAVFAERTGAGILQRCRDGEPVLFEGAQSVLLDVDHGTYPFVTSSSCVAGSAAAGAGVGVHAVGTVLGVAKAYLTRVGAGPFPTEARDDAGRRLAGRGREFGTNTGRPRRCGWLDAALLRHACRTGGIACLALTKLDVLDGLPAIQIGTGYTIDGDRVDSLPPRPSQQARAAPVYETVPGWPAPVRGLRAFGDLPREAVRYVRRIEELVEVPIVLVSTGADRAETMTVGGGW